LLPLLLAVLLLALLPWLTTWYQNGEWLPSARETGASILASAIAIAFGVWVMVLLRRERAANHRHLADLEALTLADPPPGSAIGARWSASCRDRCCARAGSTTRWRCSTWTWTG
jgi:hypothetical protein